MRGVKHYRGLLLVLVALLLLTGCPVSAVQGTKYTAFKTATAALVECADTSYDLVVGQWEDLGPVCLAKYSKGDPGDVLKILDSNQTACGSDGGKPDVHVCPRNALGIRLKALTALNNYAFKLQLVATTDYAAGVDASAAKLKAQAESLAGTADTLLPGTEDAKDAIGGLAILAREAFSLYVEGKRDDALRNELTKAQKDIEKLAVALEKDHNKMNSIAEAYSSSIRRHERVLPKEIEKRIDYYDNWVKKERSYKLSSDALKALNRALKHLPTAHAELLQSLDNPGMEMKELSRYLVAVDTAVQLLKQPKTK